MMKLLKIPILSLLLSLLFCCFGSMDGMAQSAEKQDAIKTFRQESMEAHQYFIEQHNTLKSNGGYQFSKLYSTSPESLNKWVEIHSFLLTKEKNEMAERVAEMIDIMTNKLAEN